MLFPIFPAHAVSAVFQDSDSLRPMSPDEIEARLDDLDRSDRVEVVRYGRSYEGRPLMAALVSSPALLSDLDALRLDIRLDAYAEDRPMVIWIGAAVHGNEASGAEAALALEALAASAVEHQALEAVEGQPPVAVGPQRVVERHGPPLLEDHLDGRVVDVLEMGLNDIWHVQETRGYLQRKLSNRDTMLDNRFFTPCCPQ